jgi:hypothetical protein
LRLAASQQDLDAFDVNGDECKRSTAANPPVRPNYPSLLRIFPQCRIQTPYAYKLPSASSLSSLPSGVRSLFGGQPSRPCSWQAHATQSYSTTGYLFFLSMDCFGFTAWRPEELPHMCALSVFRRLWWHSEPKCTILVTQPRTFFS